jgi:hypothetical protein
MLQRRGTIRLRVERVRSIRQRVYRDPRWIDCVHNGLVVKSSIVRRIERHSRTQGGTHLGVACSVRGNCLQVVPSRAQTNKQEAQRKLCEKENTHGIGRFSITIDSGHSAHHERAITIASKQAK